MIDLWDAGVVLNAAVGVDRPPAYLVVDLWDAGIVLDAAVGVDPLLNHVTATVIGGHNAAQLSVTWPGQTISSAKTKLTTNFMNNI